MLYNEIKAWAKYSFISEERKSGDKGVEDEQAKLIQEERERRKS